MHLAVQDEDKTPAKESGGGMAKTGPSVVEDGCVHEQLMTELLHDLRSPLAAVGMLAEMLRNSYQNDSEVDFRKLELLQEAVVKAQRIVDDASEIRNIHRGVAPVDMLTIDSAGLIRSALDKSRHSAWAKNMLVEVGDLRPTAVLADLEKAEAVLLKVLEEACLRTAQPVVVQLRQGQEDGFAQIWVQVQLPNEEASGVRRNGSTSRGRLGSRRLGESRYSLDVCRRVMDLMGGDLRVISPSPRLNAVLRFKLAGSTFPAG